MHHCRKTIIVTLVAIMCIQVQAADVQVHQCADAIGHLQAVADAKLQLAQANFDRQAYHVRAIEKLYKQGHSSFREHTIAQIQWKDLSARLASAKQYSGFVAKAAAAPDNASDTGSETSKEVDGGVTLVVNIPGLAADSRTQLFSSVALRTSNTDDTVKAVQSSAQKLLAAKSLSRTVAWSQLCERLHKIQDGSESLRNEYAITLLDKRIADAESKLAILSNAVLQTGDRVNSFKVDGERFDSIESLIAATMVESDRLQYIYLRDTADSQMQLMEEWIHRVEMAAQKGASPRSELPMLGRMIASSKNQSLFAADTLDSIADAKPNTNANNTTLVTVDRQALHTDLGASHAQLTNVREAAIDRVLLAANSVQVAQSNLYQMDQAYQRLTNLAKQDAYFLRETQRANLGVQVAQAALENAVFQHQQRVLENDYIVARIESSSAKDWLKPLSELFLLQSKSDASENLAQAQLNKEQWLIDGLNQLYQNGAATWKELTAAKVRRDELLHAIQLAKTTRDSAGLAAKLLKSPNVKLPNNQSLATF